MLTEIKNDKAPSGLRFPLGYRAAPGSSLSFLSSFSTSMNEFAPSFEAQTSAIIDRLDHVRRKIGADARIAKLQRYLTDPREHPSSAHLWRKAFTDLIPASTMLEMPVNIGYGSQIDAEAYVVSKGDAGAPGLRRIDGPDAVPEAVTVSGDSRLCTFPVAPDPSLAGLQPQVDDCFEQITARLARLGKGGLAKLSLYVRDPRSWPLLRARLLDWFGQDCPAVSCAVVGKGCTSTNWIELCAWARIEPHAALPAADETLGLIDLSREYLLLSGTGAARLFVGGTAEDAYRNVKVAGSIVDQTHVAMENQMTLLESAGATLNDVVKTTWFVADRREWEAIRATAELYFKRPLPSATVVEVSRYSIPGVRLEPDFWAQRH